MAIKLEVGKKYELNNGEVHECTKMNGDDPLAVDHLGFGPFVINGCLYHQGGTFADRDAIQKNRGVKRCVNDAPKLWRDMTPEERGALLLAHHEGKDIEQFDGEAAFWGVSAPPEWIDSVAYRVKPGPVRETVTLYCEQGRHVECWHVGQRRIGTHCITFDMIDGEPDCASIKMEKLS